MTARQLFAHLWACLEVWWRRLRPAVRRRIERENVYRAEAAILNRHQQQMSLCEEELRLLRDRYDHVDRSDA
jgi:hypothetical protein